MLALFISVTVGIISTSLEKSETSMLSRNKNVLLSRTRRGMEQRKLQMGLLTSSL